MNGISPFEEKVREALHQLLVEAGELEELIPATPDIEGKWNAIGASYLADGMREFAHYPIASLGWPMYLGMAVAHMWDEAWERYDRMEDLYAYLRDMSGFDELDELIRGSILGLRQPDYDRTETLVRRCAEQAYTLLDNAGFERGTEAAFRGYVSCLRQLYLLGAAVQLRRMGYHMEALPPLT